MSKKYDYAVFIGRFQPFHNGHRRVIDEALEVAQKVIVLVGSADSGRTLRNPFTFNERKTMILGAYGDTAGRILIEPLSDIAYNDTQWIGQVQKIIQDVVVRDMNPNPSVTIHGYSDAKIALIGHSKDNTSYYLKLFPQWDAVNVPQTELLAATNIRDSYFSANGSALIRDMLKAHTTSKRGDKTFPSAVAEFLLDFLGTSDYKNLCEEYEFIRVYKESWAGAPYAPVFVTGDAVVIQSGHVLLIRRKNHPGKGLLALPGGFVNPDERIFDGVLRELKEETGIKDKRGSIPPAVMEGYLEAFHTYDSPNRDPRGRVITHAYLFRLPDETKLYKVKGGDDAEFAQWYPLGTLKRSDMFSDHYDIIQDLLSGLDHD